ncbi:MAG TPA: biotin/lipoyl-containing protein [Candidatus Acidoferrales bacterium]
MKVKMLIQGRQRNVEATQPGERLRWEIDGREVEADAIEISPGLFSVVIGGESIEVRIEGKSSALRVFAGGQEYSAAIQNPRELKKSRAGAAEAEGRQSVTAPMAGKIIRCLVAAGDEVQTGQGVAIVEAMKMQNEIRSPKSGKVERIAVIEGQTVNSGDVVAVVS